MASPADKTPPQTASTLERIPVRKAFIGKDTPIRRALPSKQKRMIGAWCFLDHLGPVHFKAGNGLDVGPHPHTGLQTFTWMIEGEVMHTDSLGYKQLIRPQQINLMTAGYGISHTEVTPKAYAGPMHAVQLWIAQPDGTGTGERNGAARFEHYPQIPSITQNHLTYTVLVGHFLEQTSPVQVSTPLLGVDIKALQANTTTLTLDPDFEHGLLLLEGSARVNNQAMDMDELIYLHTNIHHINIELDKNARIILLGGEPFKAPIILWWNLVARTHEEIQEATQQWLNCDKRFGHIPDYPGERLTSPELPPVLKASQ